MPGGCVQVHMLHVPQTATNSFAVGMGKGRDAPAARTTRWQVPLGWLRSAVGDRDDTCGTHRCRSASTAHLPASSLQLCERCQQQILDLNACTGSACGCGGGPPSCCAAGCAASASAAAAWCCAMPRQCGWPAWCADRFHPASSLCWCLQGTAPPPRARESVLSRTPSSGAQPARMMCHLNTVGGLGEGRGGEGGKGGSTVELRRLLGSREAPCATLPSAHVSSDPDNFGAACWGGWKVR